MYKKYFTDSLQFEVLRKYIKEGNDFSREIAASLLERSELDSSYAKSLNKIAIKLKKLADGLHGTLPSAWSLVANEMDLEADSHKQLSIALSEDLSKPIKALAETQNKNRKPIESNVDKVLKNLNDKRQDEARSKKSVNSANKDREKLVELLNTAKNSHGKTNEKELPKMEKKLRQLEDTVHKCEEDYYACCQQAELCRQDWEMCVQRATEQLQAMDEERISQLQIFLSKYNNALALMAPKLSRTCDRLSEAALTINVESDIKSFVDLKANRQYQTEQLLPDFYAEDMSNAMDQVYRKQSLQFTLHHLDQDIEKYNRQKSGTEKLFGPYQNQPGFADDNAMEDTKTKLNNLVAMVNYLEASHYKVSCALADLDKKPRPQSHWSEFIKASKDKQGQPCSILVVPQSFSTSFSQERLPAEGSMQIVHTDQHAEGELKMRPIGSCRAIYDYIACNPDELTIHKDNIITIYDKQPDNWWHGELEGRWGLFPATYVEELPAYS